MLMLVLKVPVKGELKVLKQDKDTKGSIANVKFKLSKKKMDQL